jgi:choline monooxygenase
MNLPAGIPDPFENGFSEVAENSASLPSEFFTDPNVFEQEKERIFYRNWLFVGHSTDIPNAGDFFITEIFGNSIILIRGNDNEIRGFYNFCRHRGHELVHQNGCAKRITCPYHAWTYDLDGTLIAAPNADQVQNFRKNDYPLKSVGVDLLAGLIFINLDLDALPLCQQADGLEQEIREFAPDCQNLVHAHRDRDIMKCNWKVAVENWSECYHCYVVHKPLATKFIDFSTFRIELNPLYQRQRMHLREGVTDNLKTQEQASWTLLPNLGIQIVSGGYIMTSLWRPIDANHCEFIEDWFLPNAKPTKKQQELFRFRADHTQPEDVAVCEGLQRGLNNRGFRQGRLMVDAEHTELSEHGSHHIQHWVVQQLLKK